MEKRERILVSACLLGLPCRYDGRSMPCDKVLSLAEKYELVPVCPEIYGGLPTPRVPSERIGERVVMKDGTRECISRRQLKTVKERIGFKL